MLVVSDGNDVRAIKEANVLIEAGYEVTFVGRRQENRTVESEVISGIRFITVPTINDGESAFASWRRVAADLSLAERARLLWIAGLFWLARFELISTRKTAQPAAAPATRHSLLGRGFVVRLKERVLRVTGRYPRVNRVLSTVFWILIVIYYAFRRIYKRMRAPLRRLWARARRITLRRESATLRGYCRAVYTRNRYFIYLVESLQARAGLTPGVVHAHDLYMLRAAARWADLCDAKCVYDAHELERDRHPNMVPAMRDAIIDEEATYSRRADGVITVSESIRRIMLEKLDVADVSVIYNAPVIDDYNRVPERGDLRSELGLDVDTPLIVFVGKMADIFVHDHRIDNLIQAMTLLPGMHLAILGNKTPKAREQMSQWAHRYRVADRVHLVEPVPHADLINFVSSADVGVNPMENRCLNTEYSMPNKIFEYMLAGLPVAQSRLTDSMQLIEKWHIGLGMDSRSVRSIAATLREVHARKTEFALRDERLAEARASCDWTSQGKRLLELYGNVLGAA